MDRGRRRPGGDASDSALGFAFRIASLPLQRAVEQAELDQCAGDHAGMGATLAAMGACLMRDGDLLDAGANRSGAREDLGVDERADRFDRDRVEHFAVKDLEGAIDIPHAKIEEQIDESTPDRRDQRRPQGFASRCAIASDDLELFCVIEQKSDLAQVELQISIAEEDQLATGGSQAPLECRAIALVVCVAHRMNARITSTPGVEQRRTFIARAVVDTTISKSRPSISPVLSALSSRAGDYLLR